MSDSPPPLTPIAGAPSWTFKSDRVEAALTREGGRLGPVRFKTERGVVQPFAISPWSEDELPADAPPVLRHLRGDFFCAPFGGNFTPWRGERHPPHGETASRPWTFVSADTSAAGAEFVVRLRTEVRAGEVTKRIILRGGETNVYCRHELRGFSGPLSCGHHAMLAFPEENGPGQILLSPWCEGRVSPRDFESPEAGGYSALKTNAPFRGLDRVPMANGDLADLTEYPARAGFEDLVMVSSRPGSSRLAWTTVTFAKAGWLWFAVKDPRVLASTVMWHSNGGRHYPPWNGRHRRVLGLEELTTYFHFGLAESVAENPLSRAGIPTVLRFRRDRPTTVNVIMGVVALPEGFDRLRSVRPAAGHLVFTAASGAIVRHPIDLAFIHERALPGS